MRKFCKVTAECGYTWSTEINGTDEEIRNYFKLGSLINVGRGENDRMVKIAKVQISPDKGEFGGFCNRSACSESPAVHYNEIMDKHYCAKCARSLNEQNRDLYPNGLVEKNPKQLTPELIDLYS